MLRLERLFTIRSSALAVVGLILSLCGWAAASTPDLVVSQKGRKFDPLTVALSRGGTLVIVNDDGDLLHHAYIESDNFNFDSGDQQPGSRTRMVFPATGDFMVLCGIHPKMRLAVHVH